MDTQIQPAQMEPLLKPLKAVILKDNDFNSS